MFPAPERLKVGVSQKSHKAKVDVGEQGLQLRHFHMVSSIVYCIGLFRSF